MQSATELRKASVKGQQRNKKRQEKRLSANEKRQFTVAMLWFDEELPALIEYATSSGFTSVDYLGAEVDNSGERDHLVSVIVANKIVKVWREQLNPSGRLFCRKIRVSVDKYSYGCISIKISWGKHFYG